MLDAGAFIETIESRQGLKVACIEEIAIELGYIDKYKFIEIANSMSKSNYGKYLLKLLKVPQFRWYCF